MRQFPPTICASIVANCKCFKGTVSINGIAIYHYYVSLFVFYMAIIVNIFTKVNSKNATSATLIANYVDGGWIRRGHLSKSCADCGRTMIWRRRRSQKYWAPRRQCMHAMSAAPMKCRFTTWLRFANTTMYRQIFFWTQLPAICANKKGSRSFPTHKSRIKRGRVPRLIRLLYAIIASRNPLRKRRGFWAHIKRD